MINKYTHNVECKHSKDMMKWFKKFTMYDNTETIATNSSEPLLGLHTRELATHYHANARKTKNQQTLMWLLAGMKTF